MVLLLLILVLWLPLLIFMLLLALSLRILSVLVVLILPLLLLSVLPLMILSLLGLILGVLSARLTVLHLRAVCIVGIIPVVLMSMPTASSAAVCAAFVHLLVFVLIFFHKIISI